MPAWIECRECGIEFRDKPNRTKCPDCGARFDRPDDEPEEWDDEPRKKSVKKKKGGNKTLLFAGIGVGVLAVGLVVVLILLLTGKKGDASKVTLPNFQKLNNTMTLADTEAVLGGSSRSSDSDMQNEHTKAFGLLGGMQQQFMAQGFAGGGTWRRWDGKGLIVWGLFNGNGGNGERLAFSTALEKLPNGGYAQHSGQVTIGFPFGGGGNPFPNNPPIQFPPFPK